MRPARAIQIAAALAVMAALWIGLDGRQALALLAGADPRWLAAAMVALTAQTLLSAFRWRMTARPLGQAIGLRRAVSEYYLAQVVNQSLPGGVLGDAGRAVRARHQAGLGRAGAAIAIERLAGQVSLLAVLAVGAAAAAALPGGPGLPSWVNGLIGALAALGLTLALATTLAARHLNGRAGHAARHLGAAFRATMMGRQALPQVAINLTITLANLAAFAFCAHATGTAMTAIEAAVLVPLILLTMILPLTVSGWGLREGAAAGLFPLIGASAQAGLAASLAFGLVFLASTLPGLLVLALDRRRAATPFAQVKP